MSSEESTMSAASPQHHETSKLLNLVMEDGGLNALRPAKALALLPESESVQIAATEAHNIQTFLSQVTEDGGLATLRSINDISSIAWLQDPTIRQATADALRSGLAQEFLDPFAPVAARRQAVSECLRAAVMEARQFGLPLGRVPGDTESFEQLFAATLGWGPAQRYLDDPRVNEVKIVGTTIRVQEAGKPFVTVREQFASEDEVVSRAQLLSSLLGVPLDASKPQVTLPLSHGTRMHVSIAPRTRNGALVCIRRGRTVAWTIDDLLVRGSLDEATADLLHLFCRAQCSMLIIGRTGSGKTALLEALANSWPGDPHIITIEDYTMEIGIKPGITWTRELVDTHLDPLAFGHVAREALRQTPDLVLPGETRANEAGAILSLVLSDHPVITTIHARSGSDGIERFASCATLPSSYMYEGRRADALRDAASGFDVVIKIDFWAESGRRVITEIGLTDGLHETASGLMPKVIPLVNLEVGADGKIFWHNHAKAAQDNLVWHDGNHRTPEQLHEKLERARLVRATRPTAPTLDIISSALQRAEALLASGQPQRALEPLKDGWKQRHDGKLLQMAQRVLVSLPELHQSAAAKTATIIGQLDHLFAQRQWEDGIALLTVTLDDIVQAAAHIPAGGWERYEQRLVEARSMYHLATDLLALARQDIDGDRPRQALAHLAQVDTTSLEAGLLLAFEETRVAALEALVARGDAAPQALASARARRDSIAQASALAVVPQSGDSV